MKGLKEQIKNKSFHKCYLFFGEEVYLKKTYEERLRKAMLEESAEMMNLNVFNGKDTQVSTIIETSDTMPFMSDRRVVIVRESELFQAGKKDESEKMAVYLANIPSETSIIFVENTVDKRSKLYKLIQKQGYIVDFTPLKEEDLVIWLEMEFAKNKKKIQRKTSMYMIENVGCDMELLETEVLKLSAYTFDREVISQQDIDNICTKSLETKIFDMLDAIGMKSVQKALEIYSNLIMMKEAPIKILVMIIRQFRLILQTKYLASQGKGIDMIAQRLALRPFVVRGLINQAKNFSLETLKKSLEDCLETDIAIKTGKMAGQQAVELLIIKYSMG